MGRSICPTQLALLQIQSKCLSTATISHNEQALQLRAKRSIYQSDADAFTNYRLISSLSSVMTGLFLFDITDAM